MTRRRRKFLRLERAALLESKARVKLKNSRPRRRSQKPILQVVSVYSFRYCSRLQSAKICSKSPCISEPIPVMGLRRFCGLFWPFFDSKIGGHIRKLIWPQLLKSKIGSKEPQNRQKLITGIGSIDKQTHYSGY